MMQSWELKTARLLLERNLAKLEPGTAMHDDLTFLLGILLATDEQRKKRNEYAAEYQRKRAKSEEKE